MIFFGAIPSKRKGVRGWCLSMGNAKHIGDTRTYPFKQVEKTTTPPPREWAKCEKPEILLLVPGLLVGRYSLGLLMGLICTCNAFLHPAQPSMHAIFSPVQNSPVRMHTQAVSKKKKKKHRLYERDCDMRPDPAAGDVNGRKRIYACHCHRLSLSFLLQFTRRRN